MTTYNNVYTWNGNPVSPQHIQINDYGNFITINIIHYWGLIVCWKYDRDKKKWEKKNINSTKYKNVRHSIELIHKCHPFKCPEFKRISEHMGI